MKTILNQEQGIVGVDPLELLGEGFENPGILFHSGL